MSDISNWIATSKKQEKKLISIFRL